MKRVIEIRFLACCWLVATMCGRAFCQENTSASSPVFNSRFTDVRDSLVMGRYRVHTERRNYITHVHIAAPYKTGYMFGPIDTAFPGAGLEWRMANGAPIAIIVPVMIWRPQGEYGSGGRPAIRGHLLTVRGLGYGVAGMPASYIDTAIDATMPDAMQIARRLADGSYMIPPRHRKK